VEWATPSRIALRAGFRRIAAATDMTRNHFKDHPMQEPNTPEEIFELHKLRRADPQRFLQIVNEWLKENPRNFHAYFKRHYVWTQLGKPRRALDDLNKVIELNPTQPGFFARGMAYRRLGEHDNALADFARGEAMNKKEWQGAAVTLLFQADSYAQVGDEANALNCCARLPDKFWTPGYEGAPGGGKAEVAEELRRIAAEARKRP
jgi:tetratricopeptide (TPR) repeat protein